MREFLNSFPPWSAIDEHFWATDERDLAMPELGKVFKSEPPSCFVVHHHGADSVTRHLPTNGGRRNVSLAEVREQLDVHEQPVRHDDQCLDVMFQQHFQVALKSVSLVMGIRENRDVRGLIKRVLDTAQDRRAKGIGNVKKHHSDTVAPFAAE